MYKVGDGVEFYYMYNGENTWVPAIVTKAERKASSETNHKEVPHYDLELTKLHYDIINALDNNLRIPALYKVNDKVNFYDNDTASWVKTVVNKVEYDVVNTDDHRQVPYYILKLNKKDVRALASELRAPQLYQRDDEVEFYDERAGEGMWVVAKVINDVKYKAISESNHHQRQHYDLKLDIDPKGPALVKKGVPADIIRPFDIAGDTATLSGSESEYESLPETPTENGPVSPKDQLSQDDTSKMASQKPSLELDVEASKASTADDPEAAYADQAGNAFAVGDRVEVLVSGQRFKRGEITDMKNSSANNKLYQVKYDDRTPDTYVEESLIQHVFEQIGTRVRIRDSNQVPDKWTWGIIRSREKNQRNTALSVGRAIYTVLTGMDAPLDVQRREIKDIKPFVHAFDNWNIVELQNTNSQTGVVSWQLATVDEADKFASQYTLRTGNGTVTVPGNRMRPSFMVGNFVRVLNHHITNTEFSGESSWVYGVVISIDAVPGATAYLYNVLLVDRTDRHHVLPNILSVTACSCIHTRIHTHTHR